MHLFVLRNFQFDLLADYGISEAESRWPLKCQMVSFKVWSVGLSDLYCHASVVAICNRLPTKTRHLPQNLYIVLRPHPMLARIENRASRLKRLKVLVDR